jgi:hypothetical protein
MAVTAATAVGRVPDPHVGAGMLLVAATDSGEMMTSENPSSQLKKLAMPVALVFAPS